MARYIDLGPDVLPPPAPPCIWRGVPAFCGPAGLPGATDLLFVDAGPQPGRVWVDASERLGPDRPAYYGLGVLAGDFDDDGDPDVLIGVAGAPRTHAIALMRGSGAGTFTSPADSDFLPTEAFPARYYFENVAPDLDGDQIHDAVFGARANLVAVVRGGASGLSLQHYVASPGATIAGGAPDGNAVNAVLAADFDGDGALDLLTASVDIYGGRTGGLALIPGDPSAHGTFRAPRSFFARERWSVSQRGLLLGEFTGDAHVDLLAFSDTFDVMAGAGDGTFQGPPAQALGRVSGPGESYNTLRTADLDGNGQRDLVWIGTGGVQGGPGPRYLIAYADATGAFSTDAVAVYPTSWGGGQNLEIADIDGDNDLDLVMFAIAGGSPSYGEFEIFMNDGVGTRAFTRLPGKPTTGVLAFYPANGFVLADFDEDGALDIVTHAATGYTYSSRYLFFKGNRDATSGHGDGTFQPEVDFAVDIPPYTEFNAMRAVDLDGDSHLDLVAGGVWGSVWILFGDGQGGFATPVVFDTGGHVRDLRLVDLDRDGELDLASASNHGLSVLGGLGDGNFTAPQLFAIGHGEAGSFDLADLDEDGALDCLTGSGGTNNDDFVVLINDSGPRADLALTATVSPGAFDASETVLTFTFTATNKGPDAAPSTVVRIPTRVGEVLLDATASLGTCQRAPEAVTCALGALARDGGPHEPRGRGDTGLRGPLRQHRHGDARGQRSGLRSAGRRRLRVIDQGRLLRPPGASRLLAAVGSTGPDGRLGQPPRAHAMGRSRAYPVRLPGLARLGGARLADRRHALPRLRPAQRRGRRDVRRGRRRHAPGRPPRGRRTLRAGRERGLRPDRRRPPCRLQRRQRGRSPLAPTPRYARSRHHRRDARRRHRLPPPARALLARRHDRRLHLRSDDRRLHRLWRLGPGPQHHPTGVPAELPPRKDPRRSDRRHLQVLEHHRRQRGLRRLCRHLRPSLLRTRLHRLRRRAARRESRAHELPRLHARRQALVVRQDYRLAQSERLGAHLRVDLHRVQLMGHLGPGRPHELPRHRLPGMQPRQMHAARRRVHADPRAHRRRPQRQGRTARRHRRRHRRLHHPL
ncbi:MAG: VCBS repeat-containing protein [Chloroflexi bacterium]|nr:VCBS repeat-containing protein [Chloroflexota bacterium]